MVKNMSQDTTTGSTYSTYNALYGGAKPFINRHFEETGASNLSFFDLKWYGDSVYISRCLIYASLACNHIPLHCCFFCLSSASCLLHLKEEEEKESKYEFESYTCGDTYCSSCIFKLSSSEQFSDGQNNGSFECVACSMRRERSDGNVANEITWCDDSTRCGTVTSTHSQLKKKKGLSSGGSLKQLIRVFERRVKIEMQSVE